MTGGEAQLRRYELISALIMVILGFASVPFFGAIGAAIATACAVASVNLLATFEVKRRFGFNMLKIW
jgi:O-antigen/teichoic acid export membrane protein